MRGISRCSSLLTSVASGCVAGFVESVTAAMTAFAKRSAPSAEEENAMTQVSAQRHKRDLLASVSDH